jgi:hypothetical protein
MLRVSAVASELIHLFHLHVFHAIVSMPRLHVGRLLHKTVRSRDSIHHLVVITLRCHDVLLSLILVLGRWHRVILRLHVKVTWARITHHRGWTIRDSF